MWLPVMSVTNACVFVIKYNQLHQGKSGCMATLSCKVFTLTAFCVHVANTANLANLANAANTAGTQGVSSCSSLWSASPHNASTHSFSGTQVQKRKLMLIKGSARIRISAHKDQRALGSACIRISAQ